MKKGVVFILGLVAGVILTIVVLSAIVFFKSKVDNDRDITLFEAPGDVITDKDLRVFQVVAEDAALATEKDTFSNLVVLIVGNEGTFYDDQTIKVPKGMHFRQVGLYRYLTREGMIKTVPVVQLME